MCRAREHWVTFEEKKRDARASGDSFLQRGDTLYLLYDLTDSLQIKTEKVLSGGNVF